MACMLAPKTIVATVLIIVMQQLEVGCHRRLKFEASSLYRDRGQESISYIHKFPYR